MSYIILHIISLILIRGVFLGNQFLLIIFDSFPQILEKVIDLILSIFMFGLDFLLWSLDLNEFLQLFDTKFEQM